MLIAVERLLIRVRHPASRADELNALRARLRAELARAEHAEPAERAVALRVRERKQAISAAIAQVDVTSCSRCAVGLPAPQGSHAGGACCGGVTAELFDDHELAGLALAGTRPADLTPPDGRALHAGCAFRGPHGCTLDVAHRPGRCVLFVCERLQRELHDAHALDDIEAELAALQRDMTELIALHARRVDREVLAPLVAALEDHAHGRE